MFEAVLEEIRKHDTIIIHRHKNPDGDAIGSQLGLKYLLLDNFPEKKIRVVGEPARRFTSFGGTDMDIIDDTEYRNALAILLDTGAPSLISDDRFRTAARTVRIDHHVFSSQIADVEVIDPSYESCAGLVTELAIEGNLKVSKKAATVLFMGIVSDSGRFRYESTSSGTFRRASFLMQYDIDTNFVYLNFYVTSLSSLRLKSWFIDRIRFTGNRVAYFYVSSEEVEEKGITAHDAVRGYVNTMADLEGVRIWVAFAENGEEGTVEVELRSCGPNVNPIAVKYGGGGHEQASGTIVPDTDTAMALLEDLDQLAGNI
jgi:phosphoesterase RecJ-like protein